ncbi:MAG: Cna B-type domain-containing protein, partial [Mogibacterium sp.]|nr:Cna B-type domain-containing protein [Mogibacterium sp.]
TTSSKSVDTLNENDTFVWENAWVDLPYADDNGTPYNYTATETNLDGSGLWGMLTNRKTIRQILLQEWKEVNNEEIKDTLIFRIDNDDTEDKVDFSVDKIWDDANDVDGLRPGDGVKPEKIYFRLYQTIDGQATSVWDLPAGAKVKFRSNIDSTIEDVTSQYTEGYIAVEPKKDDKTQGTLNRVVFENLPKYARVNKGTSENPDWESVEIEYSVKEDGDVEETDGNKTAHTPVIDDVKVWKSDKTKAITPYTTAYGGDYEKGITVTNKHEPMKYDKEPEAKKVITGRKFKSGDKFTFTIEPVDGAPRPAKDYVTITPTVGQSEYTFKLPKFTFYGSDMKDKIENGDTKVFEYTVTELKGDLEDMTYDATSKTLKIAVTRNEDGTIEIKDGGVVWGNGREGADIFTNVYNDTTKLVIRKIWSDDDADNTVLGSRPFDSVNELRPEVIKFKITATTTVDTPALVADGVGFTKESDTEYTKEVSLSESENGTVFNRNVWQKTVDGLPKLDAAGEGITYRVDEKQLPNYEDPIVDPDGIDDGRWIITNVYKRASFTATKIWDDGNLKHDNATELKNKLKLYRTTADDPTAQGTQWTEVTDKYHLHWNDDGATADNKYSQSFTITGLPEKDADGKQYTYRVVESSVGDKYTTTYKNNDNTATSDYDESKVDEAVLDGGTITNSYQGKIIVKAQKVWEGDSEDKSKRSAVEFQLIRIRTEDNASRDVDAAKPATKGQTDDFEPIDGTNDDHYVVWPDLPTVVEGKAVSYDVKEVSVPDGYSSKTEYYNKTTDKWDDAIPDKGDWDVEKVGDEDVKVLKVRITNTLDVNETQVVVQKKWDDDDDQDRKRPKSVTVSIDAYGWDGKDIDGEDVDSITLNDDNNWKSVWKKLPKTDSEGKVYDYTVSEDAVDDYTTVVEYQSKGDKSWNVDKPEDWNNKVRVTNSYTPGRITVEVEKVWDGDEHLSDEERVALRSDVIVHLYGFKDEQVVYYAGSKKIEMDDQGEPVGRAMFANVPKRYFNDDDLDWKVVEDPVFGYTSTVSDVVPIDEGGKRYEATVTNTYAAPVTTVKVTKEWQDDNNNDGKRPENVYYQLWKKVGDKDKEKVGKPVKAVEAPTSPAGTGETGQLDGWGYQWTKLPVTEEIETEETTTTSRIEYVTKYRNKFDESIVIDETAYSGLPQTGGKSSYTYDETSGMYMPTAGGESIDQDEYDALNAQEDYEAENVPVEKKEENVKVKKEVPVLYVVEEIYEKADWTDLPDDDNLDDLDYEEPIVEAVNPGEFNVINGKKNETVDVKFIKMWNDHNDEDEIRPDHLTVVLKNDKDLPEKKVTITKGDDGWNEGYYTFTGLQKYVKGESVDYSIVELDVDGKTEIRDGGIYDKGEYSVAILKEETAVGQPESWVITNTHTLGNTEELVAIKEWEEYDGDKSKRTDVVFHLVRVYEDGARKIIDDEYPPITTATGTDHEEVLTATWTDLPTRIDKKPVAYTVEEETVDGYTTIVGDTVEKYEKVEAEGTEDPSALGWYEAEDEGYKPTEDTKVEDKDYFTRHHEVIVTNTKGVIPDRGDVIYVDPLGKAGGVGSKNMILKSTRYRTPEEAKEAMDKETNAPKVPSHPGKIFTGWAHNWDENDNFVLVATYADVADKPDPVVSYVDPQTGKIVTGVKGKVKKPADPKAKNMQFVKWVKTTDAAGNTIYVAQYECDCSNGGGKSVDKSNVDTGDDAMLTVWMLLFVMAVSFMILTMMVRRRGINVVRDNYRPKH